MRDYDPEAPLIFIHVPKTAGTSVRRVFDSWFPGALFPHYFSQDAPALPPRRDLETLQAEVGPLVVYGHFNANRGFGVPDYYPGVRQFVTLLRDPFDMHVSRYFFARAAQQDWKDRTQAVSETGLADHVRHGDLNMLQHFPRPVTPENYRDQIEEFFVEIGLFEDLGESLARIGRRLGRPVDDLALPRINVSARDEALPDSLREAFREKWPLQHDVYDYVRRRFRAVPAAAGPA